MQFDNPADWIKNEAEVLLNLQRNPIAVPDQNELNKPIHTGVYQPKLDLSPAQQMTADSVKPRDEDFSILHDDMNNPHKPLKGLFFTKRFADGGVVEPNMDKKEMSLEEKQAAIMKALNDKTLKMADGGTPVDMNTQAFPDDAPQESKLQTILKALGMVGQSPAAKVAGAVMNPVSAVADLARNPVTDAAMDKASSMVPAAGDAAKAWVGAPITPAPAAPVPPVAQPNPAAIPANIHAPTAPAPAQAAAAPSAPADPLGQLGKLDPSTSVTPGLNPSDRQALAAQGIQNQHTFGNYLGESLATLGDALAARGGVQQNSLGDIFNMQTQQRHEALDNFDKARQAAVEHFTMKNQADQNLINNLKARGEMQVSPAIAHALGHPELANRPVAQAELVLKTDSMKYDFANKMQERKQAALKNAADESDKAIAHGGMFGTQKMMSPNSRLQFIHAQAIKNDPEAFGYSVHEAK